MGTAQMKPNDPDRTNISQQFDQTVSIGIKLIIDIVRQISYLSIEIPWGGVK